MSHQDEISLTGLDGANPLGFFAALGCLHLLDAHANEHGHPAPRLSWRNVGTWQAILHDVPDMATIVERLVAAIPLVQQEPILEFAYDADGQRTKPSAEKAQRELKPVPETMRQFFAELMDDPEKRTGLDLLEALVTEVGTDRSGRVKPSALHFLAGQQRFLTAASSLCQGVDQGQIQRALVGPWNPDSELPTFSWDSSVTRLYALRADDPSHGRNKKLCEPGAEWLALCGLRCFASAPVAGRIQTTGISGGWKSGRFSWPLWEDPAGIREVRALLRLDELHNLGADKRKAIGILALCTCGIQRSDQGGYGSFQPANIT